MPHRWCFAGCRYETTEFQALVRARFQDIRVDIESHAPGVWQSIDANGSVDDIQAKIRSKVSAVIAAVSTQSIRSLWDAKPLA